MTGQTITEATASKLIEAMHKLDITVAISNEKIEAQNRLNMSQQETNRIVAETLLDMAKSNVTRDERIKALEGWKNWLNGVLTAVLIAILITVAGAILYFRYGGHMP